MARKRVIRKVGAYGWDDGTGFVRTVDGEAWQYAVLPGQPGVRDANGWEDREKASLPLKRIMTEVAESTPYVKSMGRKYNRQMYRQMHILAIATPVRFTPSPKLPADVARRFARDAADWTVHDRFTLIGFRLFTGGSKKTVGDRLMEATSPMDGPGGWVADEDFDADRERFLKIMTGAGCSVPRPGQMERAFAWWAPVERPDAVPVMTCADHLHVFRDRRSARVAQRFCDTGVDCAIWTARREVAGNYPMTICSLGVTPWMGDDERRVKSDWACDLLAPRSAGGMGALALSVRGLVEPGEVSREQIDKDADKVLDKVYQQAAENHKTNLRLAGEISAANDVYETGGRPWPSLVEGHVHVAIPDIVDNANTIAYPGHVELNPLRQEAAFDDMQIGTNVSYIPSPVFWNTPILAYSGISSRSAAGEDTGRGLNSDLPGALLGRTESDRLPVYISPFLSTERHAPPILMGVGDTGAGKTTLFLYLAAQWARLEDPDHKGRTIPGVFCDPKPASDDFGPFVRAMHGAVYDLDDPRWEGILDPVRCMPARERGEMLDTMVELIWQCTGAPEGDLDAKSYQIALMGIVCYGLDHGAGCTGEAVAIAYRDHRSGADGGIVNRQVERVYTLLEETARNYQAFRLVYGRRHDGPRLAASEGLTLLRAGSLSIAPPAGSDAAPSVIQRWVVRMMALGGAGAVMGRNGFVIMDEAHLLLGDDFGRSVAERGGRLARAQGYLPVYLSQKIDEFVKAGLTEYIGRGIILPVSAKNERAGVMSQAQAACRLFNLPEDGRLHDRMREPRESNPEEHTPNFESLYAQVDHDTGRVLRGSVPYYVDLTGSATPVVADIPEYWLRLITGKTRDA